MLSLLSDPGADLTAVERKHVDLKEDAGRRDRNGVLGPVVARSETAAGQLAGEAACMANTPGGGALIVGVADDGTVIGTGLETEWLRSRIYDLTQRLLTVDVRETWLGDRRVLVVRSPQAIEPIRWRGKIHWRVSDRCVEVDAATWHARRMTMIGYDWSDLSSQVEPVRARPEALTLARDFLRASGEASAGDLASARDPELLRRLNVVTADGYLTNAGTLAFVGRQAPALDYLRRATAGGDTDARVREGARSLLEEIAEVEKAVQQFNGTRQVQRGLVIGRVRDLPELTVREAIVNGVVHRDWASQDPTVVEHIGRSLVVTSLRLRRRCHPGEHHHPPVPNPEPGAGHPVLGPAARRTGRDRGGPDGPGDDQGGVPAARHQAGERAVRPHGTGRRASGCGLDPLPRPTPARRRPGGSAGTAADAAAGAALVD